jgi:hypothetical protein
VCPFEKQEWRLGAVDTHGSFCLVFSRLPSKKKLDPLFVSSSSLPSTPHTHAMDVLHSASVLLAEADTPAAAAFFGFMGCASALVFACTHLQHQLRA